MEEQVISIEELVQALKKRWKLILIITVAATLISAIVSFFVIKPQYEASTKLFIGKQEATTQGYNQSDIMMYQQLMKTYAQTIQTKELVGQAKELAKTDLTESQILSALTVTPVADTQILEIKLKDKNPEEAKNILEALSKKFIEKSKELVPNGNVQIIEPVQTPQSPVSPNKKMNIAIAFLLGLMVSVGICFLLEFLDNTFKKKEDLERETETPVLGAIPFLEDEMIAAKFPKSVGAETYRTLKTNIQYSSFDKECRAIVVTSADPEDGKSTTASNLAVTLGQGENSVILVDCDLRKPSIHKNFKVSNIKGLTDVVIGKETLSKAVQKVENITVLTAGKSTPNPVEMLSSKAMTKLIEDLKETYDYVILDTPPVHAVADSQILSTKADGTLLVVRAAKTKKEHVKDALNLLKKVNANIIGTVLHGVDNTNNKNYYYYGK